MAIASIQPYTEDEEPPDPYATQYGSTGDQPSEPSTQIQPYTGPETTDEVPPSYAELTEAGDARPPEPTPAPSIPAPGYNTRVDAFRSQFGRDPNADEYATMQNLADSGDAAEDIRLGFPQQLSGANTDSFPGTETSTGIAPVNASVTETVGTLAPTPSVAPRPVLDPNAGEVTTGTGTGTGERPTTGEVPLPPPQPPPVVTPPTPPTTIVPVPTEAIIEETDGTLNRPPEATPLPVGPTTPTPFTPTSTTPPINRQNSRIAQFIARAGRDPNPDELYQLENTTEELLPGVIDTAMATPGASTVLQQLMAGAQGQGEGSALRSATNAKALEQLNSPSPYNSQEVKDQYDWLAGSIDDDFATKQRQLDEEQARKGLYGSVGKDFHSGRASDLNIGQRTAKTSLARDLAHQYATTAGDYGSRAISQGMQGASAGDASQLAWLQQLMQQGQNTFGNRAVQTDQTRAQGNDAFGHDLATAEFGQGQYENEQDYLLRLLEAGYGA